jgi:uncharacterized protein
MKSKIAFATFVKTPAMSPIKTRLAADIGHAAALEFYIKSLGMTYESIEELRKLMPEVVPYWSLAEKQALGSVFWQKWPQIWQGEGQLGDRIAKVYTELKEKYEVVALYGADSPHISAQRILGGLNIITSQRASTVVGPTEDGGFYFFASRLKVSAEVWRLVKYSEKTTLEQLKKVWPDNIFEIEKDFDIDTKSEYERFQKLLN